MAYIAFLEEAQDYNSWLAEPDIQEFIDTLPQEIKAKINAFGDTAENQMADINSVIGNAIDAVNDASGSIGELESYMNSAAQELDTACTELESL